MKAIKKNNINFLRQIYHQNISGDFSHAEDICNGIYLLLKKEKNPDKLILSSGKRTYINNIIKIFFKKIKYTKLNKNFKKNHNLIGNNQLAKRIIGWLLKKEDIYKYNSFSTHKQFFKKAEMHKKLFRELLLNLKDMKKKIIGYGASTKGNVILQYCGINSRILDVIVDVNKDKHNKFTPGSKIKIAGESFVKKLKPDYMVVMPWHFKSFILNKEKSFLNSGGKLIFPLPDIEIV